MAGQWEEEQHLDDLIERRRMEGSSLKLDVMPRRKGERHERIEEIARMVH